MADSKTDEMQGFGDRLRMARERRGVTQLELAHAVGTTPGSVSRWERDDGRPQALQLARIAGHLGESLDHLVLGEASRAAEYLEMPKVLDEFLATSLGRIAQERGWVRHLIRMQFDRAPTIEHYRAFVSAMLAVDK